MTQKRAIPASAQAKRYSAKQKRDLVLRFLSGGESVDLVSQQCGVPVDTLKEWQGVALRAMDDRLELIGDEKAKVKTISMNPEQLEFAQKRADEDFEKNLSRYIVSLLKRDADGALWTGTEFDPKNEKVIEAFCRRWCGGDLKVMTDALAESNQSKVFKKLMAAFAEFLSIHRAVQGEGTRWESVEGHGSLVVMPQYASNGVLSRVRNALNLLDEVMPDHDGPILMTGTVYFKINNARLMLRDAGRCVWLMNSNEAAGDKDYSTCDDGDDEDAGEDYVGELW